MYGNAIKLLQLKKIVICVGYRVPEVAKFCKTVEKNLAGSQFCKKTWKKLRGKSILQKIEKLYGNSIS
jgi:hypothetical protein